MLTSPPNSATPKKRNYTDSDAHTVTPGSDKSVPIDVDAALVEEVGEDSSSSGNQKDVENNGNAVAPAQTLASTRERVVELEEPFKTHLFLADMKSTERLPAKWFRRLRIELTTMPESLPNNVIVFTGINCSQPNLMKILMFPESVDTPYCGGCFEFDVFIPSDYPASSPKCKLVTTGYGSVRFNPNLYNCGKVCLSLLGTWSGYQNSEGTPNGTAQSKAYNAVIRTATLEFGYLDHFTKAAGRQLTPWIVPGARETWQLKGRATAEKWAKESENDAEREKLRKQITAIDTAIANLDGVDLEAAAVGTATKGKGWFG